MRRHFVFLAIAIAACSDSTSPNLYARVTGTYSEYTIDEQVIPFATPYDTCQIVNVGGWLTLTVDGKYAMLLDRTRMLCNAEYSGGTGVAQTGTYQFVNDTVLAFVPTPPSGPAFSATFDPGNYKPEAGGRVPSLRFSFVGHEYWVIEDVPSAQTRR